jgi:hypothetical protein
MMLRYVTVMAKRQCRPGDVVSSYGINDGDELTSWICHHEFEPWGADLLCRPTKGVWVYNVTDTRVD